MKAMLLNNICHLDENKNPLVEADLPDPVPGDNEILVNVSACGAVSYTHLRAHET